jgi:lipid II:glycine glycyltransferase (peptidoglycan interpeptide bridge formation enzyme)
MKEEEDWNTILKKSKDATVFHTPEWVKLLVEQTGADSRILIVYNYNEPVGIFPYYIKKTAKFKQYARTTMFETPYGGPIAYTDSRDEIISRLIKKTHKMFKFKILGSEIILPPNYSINPFKKNKYSIIPKETMILDLNKTEDELWKTIGIKNRNMIRKAEKNGVRIDEIDNSSINEFHKMIVSTFCRLKMGPPPGLDFYKTIYKLLYPKKMIKIISAFYGNLIIAGAIFLMFNDTIIYWEAGSYKEYWKFAPNNLIQWYIIKKGNKLGYKYYDMLHYYDKKGNINLSLKKFKEGFGVKKVEYYVVRKNFPLNYISKIMNIPRYCKKIWGR